MSLVQKPEFGLKLAQVVKFASIAEPWKKVGDDHRFSMFHAKFWGKSMDDEEQEWRNLQSECRSTDSDNVIMDDGDEDADDVETDDADSDDIDTDTDATDELIPGCYELHVDPNPVSDVLKIWVRAEYIRVYEFAESRYSLCYQRRKAHALVVTGQPGIGKTVCLLYMLRRCCAERKPVVWHDGTTSGYIFVDDGVYEMAPDFQTNEFNMFVWTLVDSEEVPPVLVQNRTRLFVVYTTSPNRERWKRLHKTVRAVTVVMNPWSWREILRAVSILLPDKQLPVSQIRGIFKQFGPTPRIIQLLDDPEELEEYKRDIDIAILGITLDKLKNIVLDSQRLSMTDISSKLCLISRTKRDDIHSAHIVAPITETIKSRLASQLRTNHQIELYNEFARVPQTRKMSGILFEAVGQAVLSEGLNITLVPMV